ncbi:MAG: hypothetical protein OXD49_01490 [Candidatus Poribacteria bacterium]|nr:hypothetical protein [Candidatus Poribacteria bacterium]
MEKTFNPETFKKTFDAYVLKWHILVAILWILAFLPALAYGIAKYLELLKIDITPFLRVWDSWGPLLGNITFGAITSGIVSIGAVSFGLVSIGAVSFGVIAIGSVSCGIIAIGVTSVGVFAFGNYAAVGLIAISTGSTGISPRVGGKASGIIAIGRQTSGLYALSYEREGNGVYMFSPERQDTEAVALFTHYLRKFKSVILT